MSQAITLNPETRKFSLPLLYPGQVQKEFFVNEAHAKVDALLHAVAEGSASSPPELAEEGDCWLVSGSAAGTWAGQEDNLAIYLGSSWIFAPPLPGMRVFDKNAGQFATFNGSWNYATLPIEPEGGETIDAEARTAIRALILALRSAGVFPAS